MRTHLLVLTAILLPSVASAQTGTTPLERALVAEVTRMRADPAAWARHIEAMLPRFSGSTYADPDGRHIATEEGPAAVREAIAALRAAPKLSPVTLETGLVEAARAHVRDLGPKGARGHIGTDKSKPIDRMMRHGRCLGISLETIAYGPSLGAAPEVAAREIVAQLLIDDGVPARGHRNALLYANLGAAGGACGPHAKWRSMCVLDLAREFRGHLEASKTEPGKVTAEFEVRFLDHAPFGVPVARLPTGNPSEMDKAIMAEIIAMRANPQAWARKLEGLAARIDATGTLRMPGQPAMGWPGGRAGTERIIAAMKAVQPMSPLTFSPALSAGARDYLAIRAPQGHTGNDRYYTPLAAASRYGHGTNYGSTLAGGMEDAFVMAAYVAVSGGNPPIDFLRERPAVLGLACAPHPSYPQVCTVVWAYDFTSFMSSDLLFSGRVFDRLQRIRANPKAEAKHLRSLADRFVGDDLEVAGHKVRLDGGRRRLDDVAALLDKTPPGKPLRLSGGLQRMAIEYVLEAARKGAVPGSGSWTWRRPDSYGKPGRSHEEVFAAVPDDPDLAAAILILHGSKATLGAALDGGGVGCAAHPKAGRVCAVDASEGFAEKGGEMP